MHFTDRDEALLAHAAGALDVASSKRSSFAPADVLMPLLPDLPFTEGLVVYQADLCGKVQEGTGRSNVCCRHERRV